MRNVHQVLRDPPDVVLRRHPARVRPVESSEVDRLRVGTQGPLAAQVHIALEVAHHQLAHAPVHGLAKSQTREVRLRDGAPVTTQPVHGDHVIAVLLGFEVEEERRESEDAQGSSCEDGALEAVRGALAQHASRGPRGGGDVIGHRLECLLDPDRGREGAQGAPLPRREAEAAIRRRHCVRPTSSSLVPATGTNRGWPYLSTPNVLIIVCTSADTMKSAKAFPPAVFTFGPLAGLTSMTE